MTDAQIKGNKLIVYFVADAPQYKKAEVYYEYEVSNNPHPDLTGLKYHESYDWLMPIIEKIEQLLDTYVNISGTYCEIFTVKDDNYDFVGSQPLNAETKLQGIFNAIFEFLEWYNKNK